MAKDSPTQATPLEDQKQGAKIAVENIVKFYDERAEHMSSRSDPKVANSLLKLQ